MDRSLLVAQSWARFLLALSVFVVLVGAVTGHAQDDDLLLLRV
jgi:hypothetical protein